MDCLFCKIVNGEIPSKTIYEDDLIKVFLDINPTTNGDMLIVPKKHYENIMDIDDKLIPHIHNIAKEMFIMLKQKLSVDGLTLVQNNEHGQEIKHYHLHVTPRYTNDEIMQSSNKKILVSVEDVFEQIKN
ncbi:MAG: HIT domain-containing protein [Bacilli bacterium]|nr:HIT domain-containing protein [Bacilli bacterium]